MFDNVNYSFYSDALGRAVIPDEATFNKYKLEEVAYMRTLLPFVVSEREENGTDKAACMFIEEAYIADSNDDDGRIETSVSLDGYSTSYDIKGAKTPSEKREKWLNLFCVVSYGVK